LALGLGVDGGRRGLGQLAATGHGGLRGGGHRLGGLGLGAEGGEDGARLPARRRSRLLVGRVGRAGRRLVGLALRRARRVGGGLAGADRCLVARAVLGDRRVVPGLDGGLAGGRGRRFVPVGGRLRRGRLLGAVGLERRGVRCSGGGGDRGEVRGRSLGGRVVAPRGR